MKVKLDENLGHRAAALLRSAGHEVTTVSQGRLQGASDNRLIEMCRAEGRCLVTLDLEFGNPLVFPPTDYPGIAVLRLPPVPAPQDIFLTMQTLVANLESEKINGKLWIVQPGRIREYQPES